MKLDIPAGATLPTARLLGSCGLSASSYAWSTTLIPVCLAHQITTPPRLAAFLANTMHETGGFSRLVENLNYSVQALLTLFGTRRGMDATTALRVGRQPGEAALGEGRQRTIANILYGGEWGRRNLGNTEPDDGWRFRGRGLMQTTGRANYTRFARSVGRELDDDFLAWLTTMDGAAASAGAFWAAHDLNALADDGALMELRRRINGGTFGLEDVMLRHRRLIRLIELDRISPSNVSLLLT